MLPAVPAAEVAAGGEDAVVAAELCSHLCQGLAWDPERIVSARCASGFVFCNGNNGLCHSSGELRSNS